jgi:mRNA-degrading endonuclease RelE of RelBE toxin-antitoxin system
MKFDIYLTQTARKVLRQLKKDPGKNKDYKAAKKAIVLLSKNPRHPGLQTHIIYSIKGPSGGKVFEAYAQQNTPSAYRIFFYYGPNEREITVFAIIQHP